MKNDFRNEFEHFAPQLWIIEITGFPKMISNILEVIEFLTLESRNILYEKVEGDDDYSIHIQEGLVKTIINEAKRILNELN